MNSSLDATRTAAAAIMEAASPSRSVITTTREARALVTSGASSALPDGVVASSARIISSRTLRRAPGARDDWPAPAMVRPTGSASECATAASPTAASRASRHLSSAGCGNAMDADASTIMAVLNVARSVVSRTYARSLRASNRQSTRRGSSPCRYGRNALNSDELPVSREGCAPRVAPPTRRAAGHRTPRTASSSAPYGPADT